MQNLNGKVIQLDFKVGELWQPSSPRQNLDVSGTFWGVPTKTELGSLDCQKIRETNRSVANHF